MVYVLQIENPFEPFNTSKEEIESGITIHNYLCKKFNCEWEAFERPTICILNGEAVMQKDYKTIVLKDNDILSFVTLVGGFVAAIIAIVLTVVAVAISFIFAPQPPSISDDVKGADSVYSLKGRSNSIKLGQEVPCGYGLVRNWPDYAAQPYNIYQDNQQYQFSLFCLGHGEYDVSSIKINNTPIENFKEIEYEIVKPFESIYLFRDNVITSTEVMQIEIKASNESFYVENVGPYVLNDPGTRIDRIEVDVSFPKGLYKQNDDGGLDAKTISGYFEFREIDDDGNAVSIPVAFKAYREIVEEVDYDNDFRQFKAKYKIISDDYVVADHSYADGYKVVTSDRLAKTRTTRYYIYRVSEWVRINFTKTLKTTTAQRFTLGIDVPLGRYQIRFSRTNTKDTSFKAGNDLYIDAVRGFMPNITYYGDKTLLALKALATSNLNDRSANQVNLLQQRKLATWDGDNWTDRVATKNPVWAMFDALKAEYGGRINDAFIDFDTLTSLAETFDTLGVEFNYIFSSRSNVWEVCKTILSVGKAIPVLNGSKISAVRDYYLSLPEFIFTDDTIIKDSFKWSVRMNKLNDYDGLEIEYIDEDTFKPELITCLVGTDTGQNLEKIKLIGVTNRDKAYDLGLYNRAMRKYRRESVSFKTDIQGFLPNVNSLIGVTHNITNWGVHDIVKSITGDELTLGDYHNFDLLKTYNIMFKQRTGYASEPFLITPLAENTNKLTITGLDISLERLDNEEPLICQIGEENKLHKLLRVKSLAPVDSDIVEIECVNNDNRIYNFEEVTPPITDINSVGVQELPVIENLVVFPVTDDITKIRVSWSATNDAKSFVVEYSYDNISFTQIAFTNVNYHVFDILTGNIYIRVAGINAAQGPWSVWNGEILPATVAPDTPTGLALESAFVGPSFKVIWDLTTDATSYVVRIYRDSNGIILRTVETSDLFYEYGIAQLTPDFGSTPERTLRVTIQAKNIAGESAELASPLVINNPIAATLTGISLSKNFDEYFGQLQFRVSVSWTASTETDIKEYRVYGSGTNGFTPGPSNLRYTGTANSCYIYIPASSAPSNYRVRVVAIDYWGNELTNISSQQSISLF